ncbi:amino acid adenylation domain-containing protein [Lysinibacillus sp. NPDC059133]|uniref:non-ribosomal peptide synthetase family protein n=1 Tax=Lysinibacillus sp. NPDC059133 TaxID=3346737 RepID=UPI0036786FE5
MNRPEKKNVIQNDLREKKKEYSISSAQKRLWFLNQMNPDDPNYHIHLVFKLNGKLNLYHLQESMNRVVSRHESLRTSFHMVDGSVVQKISNLNISIKVVNKSENNYYPLKYIKGEIKKPFDLEEGPLLRAYLIQENEDCSYFVMILHHIISDGWSNDILLKELSSFYNSLQLGKPDNLNEVKLQYHDFTIWEEEQLNQNNKRYNTIVEYWKNKLNNYPYILKLPTDLSRNSESQINGRTEITHLSEEFYGEIKAFSLKHHVSIYMTLYTAFTVLIHRFSGQETILTGTPVANRNEIDFEKIVGLFVNTIVIPSDITYNPSFSEHLKRIRINILDAFDHQDIPFDRLVEIIKPERHLSINPLFQTAFSYHKKNECSLELDGIVTIPLDIDSNTSKTDIYMVVEERESNVLLAIEYNSDLFNSTTIRGLLNAFKTILKTIVKDASIKVKDISLLNNNDKKKIIHLLDEKSNDTSNLKCVHQLFEENALNQPNAVAIEIENEKMTYSQLNYKANILAKELQKYGITKEMVIGICVDRSFDMVVALLGVFKAGASYLPLDPSIPIERLNYMLEDSDVKYVITNDKVNPSFNKENFQMLYLNLLKEVDGKIDNLNVEVSLDNLAYTIYTSGTTGKPKGVQIPHRGLSNLAYNEMNTFNIRSGSKVLHVASFGFDAALYGILITLINGGTLIIADLSNHNIDYTINDLLVRKKINYANLTPSFLRAFKSEGLDSLETIVSYGEELTNAIIEKWASPKRKIYNGYGPTETTVGATSIDCTNLKNERPPIGRLFKNYSGYVLDEKLQLVPVGFEGELYISGVGLARGYISRPDSTAEKFIPNPFSKEEERMYRTGDIVKILEDGNLMFVGRKDDQLKIRGYRIEMKDIESTILECPLVKNVFIDVVDNNGEKKIVGYLVYKDSSKGSTQEVIRFLKTKLPSYMIPSKLISINSFPLTPNGKLDKKALPIINFTRDLETPYKAPSTELEIAINEIWKEVLSLEKISVDDDFFEIGGQSLLVAKLVYKISEYFNTDLPIRVIFKDPTISGMAKMIEKILENGINEVSDQIGEVALSEETIINDNFEKVYFNKFELSESSILLTGVTGFLGAFILNELLNQTKADIYCLVRASNEDGAMIRIQNIMSSYGLWNEYVKKRIIPIPGDLSSPKLGLDDKKFDFLASTVDVVYHNGALVNFTYPYHSLEPTNVGGTHEIIRLSRQKKIKPIHFISTLSVFPTSPIENKNTIYEDDISTQSKGLGTGYSQTKWVAEQILQKVRDSGHPINIYRLSRMTGDSISGACQPDDFLWKFIQCCIEMNSFPDIEMEYDVIPVDIAAKSIVKLSNYKEFNENYHIFNENKLPYSKILEAVKQAGYSVKIIPFNKWEIELNIRSRNSDKEIFSIINVISKNSSNGYPAIFNKEKTDSKLDNNLFVNPKISIESLKNTILYFINKNAFRSPY